MCRFSVDRDRSMTYFWKIIKYCTLHDEPWRSPFRLSRLSVIQANYYHLQFRIFLRKVIESSFWCKYVSFASCIRAYETWKQCQWIMRTLTHKHKIWGGGGDWFYLRPYLKAFPVFNVLETCRVYLLTIDLGIAKFIKKFIERLFENAKFAGMDQITSKNCNKSSWTQDKKILLTRERPEQFPSFFVRSFQWNQITMRWSRVSKAYHFLKILANRVDSMLFHCFYDA